jgi:hypothetical protein
MRIRRRGRKMRNNFEFVREGASKRCPICEGRFGLVRHYSWRTALCSRRCVDRFKARQKTDREWLSSARAPQHSCIVHRS